MSAHTVYPVIDLVKTGRRIEYPQAIYKWQHGECLSTVDNLLALARLRQV